MEDVVQTSDDESIRSESNSSVMEENEAQEGNRRLADALTKALRMAKIKHGGSIVLSKAKLYSPKTITKTKSHGFEIEPGPNNKIKDEEREKVIKLDLEDMKPDKKKLKMCRITKPEKLERGRLKPSPLDREKERPLVKIATKGVVQLFNAVRQQQLAINKQINTPGVTEGKKDKILQSIDKKAFLDVLMGKVKSGQPFKCTNEVSNKLEDKMKSELKDEEPSWQVLKNDFMMGAKLKDWDKKEIEVEP